MNTKVLLLALVCLVIAAPIVSADPDRARGGQDAATGPYCIDVVYTETPPVAIYECPWTGP